MFLATISESADAVDSKGMRPVSSMTPKEIRMEKLSIWKNILVICLSFMCLFTAFNSMANLQSSINSTAGLGKFWQKLNESYTQNIPLKLIIAYNN